MIKKIVLLGSSGMLGHDIKEFLDKKHILLCPTRRELNLENWRSIDSYFAQIRNADLVINTAAFTNVDLCETESKRAFQINATAVQAIAKCCEQRSIPLLHISTDYVFNGDKEVYTVNDIPSAPLSIYGRSKLLAEDYIKQLMKRYYIVRTSWLYGANGKNFVKTILNIANEDKPLRIVSDQVGCPTYTQDLVFAIYSLIENENYGIHHASGTGSCSWYEFARKILELKNIEKTATPISTRKSLDLFPNIKAIRPKYSVLQNTVTMPMWDVSLRKYLNESTLDQR